MNAPEPINASEIPISLRFEFPLHFGFVSHFARIVRSSGLETQVGIPLPARGSARIELALHTSATVSLHPQEDRYHLQVWSTRNPSVQLHIDSLDYGNELISLGLASFCKSASTAASGLSVLEPKLLHAIPEALQQALENRLGFVSQNGITIDMVIGAEDWAVVQALLAGERVWTPDALPASLGPLDEQLRSLIGFVPQNRTFFVELEIRPPLLTLKQAADPAAALANAEVSADGFGQLALHLPAAVKPIESCRTALALACGDASSFNLVFQTPLGPDLSSHSLLLNLYGLAIPHPPDNFTGSVLTLRLPGRDLTAWFDCPAEKKIEFFHAYVRVSKSLQQTLRVWLAHLWFADLDRCKDRLTSFSFLTFLCSRFHVPKDRTRLVDDVLLPDAAERLYTSVGPRLPIELKRIETRLLRAGKQSLASPFHSSNVEDALRVVKRNPRILLALIVLQSSLFDCLIKLGLSSKNLGFAEDLPACLEPRLRKVFHGFDCRPLAPLILMTASHAMSTSVRGSGGLAAQLVLHLPDGRRQISACPEISSWPEALFLQDNQ